MARRSQVNLDLIPFAVREAIEAELRLNQFESQKAVAMNHGVGTRVVSEIVARLRLQRVPIKNSRQPKPTKASQFFIVPSSSGLHKERPALEVADEVDAPALLTKRRLDDLFAAREDKLFDKEVWDG